MASVAIPVTLSVAAGCAAINLWLQIRVGQLRGREKVSIGDGGNEPLIRRMRAHANFVENAPFVLLLILGIELARGPCWWLWAAGALFLLARVAHPFGMDGVKYARTVGTATTMLVTLALAVWAVVVVYQRDRPNAAITTEAVPPSA